MPRGGARPFSGRPRSPEDTDITGATPAINEKRSYERLAKELDKFKKRSQMAEPLPGAEIVGGELTMPTGWLHPLVYMAGLLNNPDVDPLRRDRIAVAMLPYLLPRRGDTSVTAKQKAEDAARQAGQGTAWSSILRTAA